MPLMQVRGFSLHSSTVNFLMPPTQDTRHREMWRMAQHRSIANTLHKVYQEGKQQGGTGTSVAGEAKAAEAVEKGGEGDAETPGGELSVLSWQGPKLVPELCSVQPLPLWVWR
eukprot:jgi/Ulvmu1/10478/UM064_0015.1